MKIEKILICASLLAVACAFSDAGNTAFSAFARDRKVPTSGRDTSFSTSKNRLANRANNQKDSSESGKPQISPEKQELYDLYQLQYVENIKKAEIDAQSFIAKGNKLMKDGSSFMMKEDYTTPSVTGTGRRYVSRAAERKKGALMYEEGEALKKKGEILHALVKDVVSKLVHPDMIRTYTSKDGKTIRGAVLSVKDGKVTFIDKKNKVFVMKLSVFSDNDIEYLTSAKIDLNIDILPNVFSGRLLNGEEIANPIAIKIMPLIENNAPSAPLSVIVKVDSEFVSGASEQIEIKLEKDLPSLFFPKLEWNIEKLQKLTEDVPLNFSVSVSSGAQKVDKKAIVSIKPPLVLMDISPLETFNGGIFPSVILSNMNFYGEKGVRTFPFRDASFNIDFDKIVKNENPFIALKLKVEECNGFDSSKLSITLSSNSDLISTTHSNVNIPLIDGETLYLYPEVKWNFDALSRIKEPQPISITIAYKLDNQAEKTVNFNMVAHPVNDVLMYAPDPILGGLRNYANMFAAFVNENHPEIENIKKEALEKKYIDGFYGTQKGFDGVLAQMNAIWRVLQDRGIKYSSYTESMASNAEKIVSQRVRFFDEALKNKQANCADGSVMFASILKNIGLDPVLIIAPGHMYCGVKVNGKYFPFETTLLGSGASLIDAVKSGIAKMQKREDAVNEIAVAEAYGLISSSFAEAAKDKFSIIDISECRRAGIFPIASKYIHKTEE